MANALYDHGRRGFLEGDIAWLTDTINVILIDTADYTVDLVNDDLVADVPAAARVSETTLTGKTSVGGVANSDDAAFALVTGDTVEAAVIYDNSTGRLIAYLDTVAGFPFTPNGGNVVLQWSVQGIFKL